MKNIKKVPLILQNEITECGAASLAMVLSFYGRSVPIERLRIECGVSRDGVTAKNIKKAADGNGLKTKAFRMGKEKVKKIVFPAIIHWNMQHFVVLCGFNKKGAVIADPALGYVNVSEDEFAKAFTGIVLTFEKTENFVETENNSNDLKSGFIYKNFKEFIPLFIYTSLMLAVISAVNFIIPFFDSVYIDKILASYNYENISVLILFIIVSGITITAAILLNTRLILKISVAAEKKINKNFMTKILKYPIEFFSQRNPGELTNRQSGNMQITNILCKSAVPIPLEILMVIVYIVFFFVFDIHIGFISIFAVFLNIIAFYNSSSKLKNDMVLYQRDSGVFQGSITSSIDMIETVKACGCENGIFSKLTGLSASLSNTKNNMNKTNIYSSVLFSVINNIIYSLIIVIGIWKVLSGEFTAGVLIAVSGMMTAFMVPIGNAVNSAEELYNLKGLTVRTNDAMNYQYTQTFLPDNEEQKAEIKGDIYVDNVSFSYNVYDEAFINNFSLKLEAGKSIALTGGSGSGKSTVSKIISGLFIQREGEIYYSGSAKNKFKEDYFYSKIAVVDQKISLFEGTIYDNITMWDNNISYEMVVKAAKDACIHNEIIVRKNGYFDNVFSNGKNFSGGQCQRIEIARALAKNPEILILDEATSALDAKTEAMIMENIKKRNITLIIVAHRLSTIRDCEEIIVMDNGKIAERGTHKELLELDGKYAELVYDKQGGDSYGGN